MSNERWLSRLSGDTRLRDVVLPGSHDAGVYGDSLTTRKSTKSWARCQTTGISGQAGYGSRMFDCRVFLKKVDDVIVPTMGHFFKEKSKHSGGATGSGGAYGGSLIDCLTDAVAFVTANPTEFLILRFSHTYCPGEVAAALTQFMALGNNAAHISTSGRNVARRRIDDLRGKVIMVFATEFHTAFNHRAGYLPFYKYTGAPTADGLCTCGIYKSTSDMKKVHGTAAQGFAEHKAHFSEPGDHLHFVYWQQTLKPGDIKQETGKANSTTFFGGKEKLYSGGAHANLGNFIDEIRAKVRAGEWRLPNIISHDFVKEETCNQIIALNPNLLAA